MTTHLTFVPGTMCDERVWAPVRERLTGDLTFGYIPLETARTGAEFRSLFEVAHEPTGQPLNLVAFSMGGYLAFEFALQHPGKVASLITVSSSAFGLHEDEKRQRRNAVGYLEKYTYRGIADARLNQMLHPSRQRDEALKQVMRDMDRDLGVETLKTQMREMTERADLFARLHEIACPVMIIGADADPFLTPNQLAAMTNAIPGAVSASASISGHMIPLERPDWLAEQVNQFYAR